MKCELAFVKDIELVLPLLLYRMKEYDLFILATLKLYTSTYDYRVPILYDFIKREAQFDNFFSSHYSKYLKFSIAEQISSLNDGFI